MLLAKCNLERHKPISSLHFQFEEVINTTPAI